jgi:hypothetical protein
VICDPSRTQGMLVTREDKRFVTSTRVEARLIEILHFAPLEARGKAGLCILIGYSIVKER